MRSFVFAGPWVLDHATSHERAELLGEQTLLLRVIYRLALQPRYQRLVRARQLEAHASEKQKRRDLEASEMLRALSESEQPRYHGLNTLSGEIRENYKGLDSSSQVLLDEVVQKLEFLLSFYLRMRY